MKKKLHEFCLNSKRYILKMAWKGKPPLSCPYREDNFISCENCSYYTKKSSRMMDRLIKWIEDSE